MLGLEFGKPSRPVYVLLPSGSDSETILTKTRSLHLYNFDSLMVLSTCKSTQVLLDTTILSSVMLQTPTLPVVNNAQI